jgi:predicted transcriptional regulator of viral defense system
MRHTTHAQRVLQLLRQKGIVRPSDLEPIGVPRVVLTRMTADGHLQKVSRGVYRSSNGHVSEHESLATIATRVPQGIFCLLTALQFHDLTTQLPRQVWIAMPRGSHAPKIDYPPIRMVQFSGDAYSEGVEVIERDQVKLRVYSVPKTVADCFKVSGWRSQVDG